MTCDREEQFGPGKLWSLWDLLSPSLTGLLNLVFQLSLYDLMSLRRDDHEDRQIDESTHRQVEGWLRMAAEFAENLEMDGARDRISIFKRNLSKGMTWGDLSIESRVLREALECGLRGQFIYRYSNEQRAFLERWQADWKEVIEQFPDTKNDVFSAVDCCALGHGTASVFHSMRVLEYGLSALASHLDIEVGVQNWQVVIDQIESKIRAQAKTLPRGIEKSERLQFLSEAAKELYYFKDGWRNYVSHNRATYDAHQARSVIEHVRSFMTHLSKRISQDETF
ncbi:MAG: hypothetical protein LPK88_02555 [Alphaproteobacteria bacterium]|nr:hypothetical protein [Alphaproteobacteria bacterium]MDX5415190.1 hypothetical protein [Alphaproteobacteria bacterium]MDX5492388.1 hypothetical protein [Alphaproteobacteria bacterium]